MSDSFEMNFDMGNAAFEGQEDRRMEVARVLRETANRIEAGVISGPLHDLNGNLVGDWGMDEFEEPDCEHCGGEGIEPATITADAGDGEGEDRPCSVCAS